MVLSYFFIRVRNKKKILDRENFEGSESRARISFEIVTIFTVNHGPNTTMSLFQYLASLYLQRSVS